MKKNNILAYMIQISIIFTHVRASTKSNTKSDKLSFLKQSGRIGIALLPLCSLFTLYHREEAKNIHKLALTTISTVLPYIFNQFLPSPETKNNKSWKKIINPKIIIPCCQCLAAMNYIYNEKNRTLFQLREYEINLNEIILVLTSLVHIWQNIIIFRQLVSEEKKEKLKEEKKEKEREREREKKEKEREREREREREELSQKLQNHINDVNDIIAHKIDKKWETLQNAKNLNDMILTFIIARSSLCPRGPKSSIEDEQGTWLEDLNEFSNNHNNQMKTIDSIIDKERSILKDLFEKETENNSSIPNQNSTTDIEE